MNFVSSVPREKERKKSLSEYFDWIELDLDCIRRANSRPPIPGGNRTNRTSCVVLCAKKFIRFVDRKNEERKFIENSRKIECSIFISNRVESRQDGRSAYETRVSAGSLGDGE